MNTKPYISLRYFLALLMGLFLVPVFAQDDLYYDPARDRVAPPPPVEEEYPTTGSDQVTRRHRDADEYYGDDDEYAYEYSSRIRRFHRPARVVEYYDPFFTDLWMYDPYYLPGASIYTYGFNDYWSWRRWNRWNRWNSWNNWNSWNAGWGWGWNNWYGPSWNTWGWNSPWNTPFVVNNYYYDPYWTWNGWNPYCANVNNFYGNGWNNWNNNNNGNNNGFTPRTYTGTRRHGSSVNPGYARIADDGGRGRLSPDGKGGPVIEKSRGRVMTDREPDAQRNGSVNSGSNGRRPMPADAGRTRGADDRSANPASDGTPGRVRIPDGGRSSEPAASGRNNDGPARRRPMDDGAEPRTARPDDGGRPARTTRPADDGRGRDVRPSRPTDGGGRDARPARPNMDDRNDRSDRPARPSYEPRPSRPSNDGGSDMRPSRPSGGNDGGRDMRPSRPSSEPRSNGGGGFSPSRGGGGDGGGGSRGSSGGSNGGGRSSSGSGSRGRQ